MTIAVTPRPQRTQRCRRETPRLAARAPAPGYVTVCAIRPDMAPLKSCTKILLLLSDDVRCGRGAGEEARGRLRVVDAGVASAASARRWQCGAVRHRMCL